MFGSIDFYWATCMPSMPNFIIINYFNILYCVYLDWVIDTYYKFARKQGKILQKCNIIFLDQLSFAACEGLVRWIMQDLKGRRRILPYRSGSGFRLRHFSARKGYAATTDLSKITFWSFSRHVAASILSYHQFQCQASFNNFPLPQSVFHWRERSPPPSSRQADPLFTG